MSIVAGCSLLLSALTSANIAVYDDKPQYLILTVVASVLACYAFFGSPMQ